MRTTIAILVLVMAAAAQQTAPISAAIEGTVLDARTGVPIAAATVRLMPNNGVETFTNQNGVFSLDQLTPGRLEIHVNAVRHVGQTLFVDLAAGERRNSVAIRLDQTGVISGRIVDSKGQPITGIFPQTLVYTHSFPGSNSAEVARADQADVILHPVHLGLDEVTDDRGEFRIYDVPPGEYYLRISHGNNPTLGAVLYPGVVNLNDAVPIKVKAGEEVRLTPVTMLPSTLGWITAQVTNAIGEIPNLITSGYGIFLSRGTGDLIEATRQSSPPAVRPDSPGQYHVCVYIPINGVSAMNCRDVDYTGAAMNLDFTVTKPDGSVRGRILVEQKDGLLTKPLGDISIATDIMDIHQSILRIKAKSDGSFDETDIYAGHGRLVALTRLPGRGNPNYYLASAHQGDRDVLMEGMRLSNRDSNVEIVVSVLGGVLRGKVTDDNGNSIPDAAVALVPDGALLKRTDKADTYRTGQSDINGMYEIRGLIPGSYRAYAATRPEGWAYWDSSYMKKFDALGKSLEIEKAGSVSADLTVITIDTETTN